LAIVCSGTATLECAVLQVPMVISYKGTWITYQAAKRMIKVPHLGLPNLILQKRRFPELLQYDATPEKIAKTVLHLLQDKKALGQMEKDLAAVSERLGAKGAIRRTAEEVLKLIK
jgi:lipid-A-disaccharide synthase